MLKSDILKKLELRQTTLNENDIELIFNIFTKKIIHSLNNGQNVELRGFGSLKKKLIGLKK
jgi:nucleoid DNA-binding protein